MASLPNLTQVLINLSNSLGEVGVMLTAFAYISGFGIFFAGVTKLRPENKHVALAEALFLIFFASFLIYLPTAMHVVSNTYFPDTPLSYTQAPAIDFNSAIHNLVQFMGILWFVHGCLIARKGYEAESKKLWRGILYITAGVAAMNFPAKI